MNTSCNKTSNNKYFDCPARMDDGRGFTDYRPNSTVNDMIRYSNNIMGSNEYRQFLIHNAVNIMNISNNYTASKMGCNSCNYEPLPFNTQCDYNNNFPVCNVMNPNGIGIRNNIVGMNSIENFYSELDLPSTDLTSNDSPSTNRVQKLGGTNTSGDPGSGSITVK
jgi:hypothetical protein